MTDLNMLYVHAGWIGYGRVGVQLAEQLDQMGITVYDHLAGSESHYDEATGFVPPALQLQAVGTPADHKIAYAGRKGGRSNVVCWVSVPSHGTGWFEGQIPIVFTMWEGMRLPEQFRESLHEFETCIVPSMQNVELFSRYHDNVKYVPLGIDPVAWHYQRRTPPDRYFRFLHGGSGQRKGGDLVAQAFKKLWPRGADFGDGPIPVLTFKSPKGETYYGERIDTIGGHLPAEDEIALYAQAHCYVQPSRGEGFGLQPLQAIAQGCPTILTADHGHGAFSHLGLPVSSTPVKSDYFIFGDAGDWWEPSLDEICDYMADVYENYDRHQARAEEASTIALKQFTWRRTAEQFLDAIGRDRLEVPYSGSGVWHEVESKKFKTITNVDHYCEIAGNQLQFYKGTEYWQSADIKRILFEAGKLDVSCLDDEEDAASGLTDMQLQRADKYRAQMEHCSQCGQRLP